ncbi:MAG: hypothetical protein R3E68_08660 [Burkholderiaceae bacterium]
MKLTSQALALALLVAITVPAVPSANAASSEILDLDPRDQALLAKEKVKQRGPNRLNRSFTNFNEANHSNNCGNVDIGNQQQQNSARNQLNPRQSTVIVTGPVINAANCR